MDFYADVLDHTGRTPRELGALQLHVEPVTRAPSGEALAVLWLQSAFEPLPSTGEHTLLLMGRQKNGDARRMLGQYPVPRLEGGRVVRWRLPVSLPAEFDELHVEVQGRPHPKAERVRPAWKLLDVIELPREDDLKQEYAPTFGINVAESVVGTLLSGGPSLTVTMSVNNNVQALRVKRHAAAAAPTAFIAAVVEGAVEPLSEPHLETVWAPGMPLPEASAGPAWTPAPPAAPAPPRATRTCKSCFFEGSSAEYARATMCPMCDATWY